MASTRKVATTIYITVEQDEKLKLLSQSTGTSMAQYIREGIDYILELHKDRLPQQLGLSID
ncbi:MAG: ribbon-helix-helix domain-containing protein [Deltaproteobacteria bacterium]|nr:MAG: ribbon-helix-helix domain-containing protein [Deltaproteobacteria bacterium]